MRIRHQQRRRRANQAALFAIFMLLVGAVAAVGLNVMARNRAALERFGQGADDLNPVERFVLTVYLATHMDDLTAPAGTDSTPIPFAIQPGEAAATVAERLAAEGLVRDAQLLNLYLRYQGYDDAVEAGDFILRQTMTTVEIAAALTDASAREVSVRIVEGWRLEQMAEALSANPDLAVSREEFLALGGPAGPRTAAHAFLSELPAGASLEGFLFPDTYIVRPGASAADLIGKMLANFETRLPAGYRAAIAKRGLTLYQAVTLASLVEREAVVDDERPLIASVVFNRLAIGQPLEIDATVQYALGTPENWWPSVSGLDFRAIQSPYNTYSVTGLPAGPIANPGQASILAVASPADVNYLYYRALCDGSGRHVFAATYEEHLANTCP